MPLFDEAARAEWQRHPNIDGPASTLLAIHDQFRVASRRLMLLLAEPDPDLGWMARAFAPLSQTLHHHHHAEEIMLFPLVHKRTGDAPERLVSDHGELTSAITAVEKSLSRGADRAIATAAVTAFDEILMAHLAREEALVIPVLLEMSPREAWVLIHGA